MNRLANNKSTHQHRLSCYGVVFRIGHVGYVVSAAVCSECYLLLKKCIEKKMHRKNDDASDLAPSAFADFFLTQHKQLVVLEGSRTFSDGFVALCENVVKFLVREVFNIDVVLTAFHQRPPLVLLHINSLFITDVQPA